MNGNVLRWVAALVAVLFGMMTVKSGGQVLFGPEEARVAAGNYIPFVLWFNFLAGFLYVITGVAIAMGKKWSLKAALFLMSSTLLVFAAFGLHIMINEVSYETRTVIAMAARSTIWAVISFVLFRHFVANGEALVEDEGEEHA